MRKRIGCVLFKLRVGVGALLIASIVESASAQLVRTQAVVTTNKLTVRFPTESQSVSTPARGEPAYYAWRITLGAPMALSLVLASDTALRAHSLGTVVRAGTLRQCADPATPRLRDCKTSVAGSAREENGKVVIEINDPTIVKRILSERPSQIYAFAYKPYGRYLAEFAFIEYRVDK